MYNDPTRSPAEIEKVRNTNRVGQMASILMSWELDVLISLCQISILLASRDVTNSWLRQNRISEYGEYGQKWAVFVFSKRKTALFEHQIRFSE